jgi:D-specific alpha-keto acid dehydrogenase
VTRVLGLTVFGCEHDETELFRELSPRFGVVPTTTSAAVSEHSIVSATGNRCVSVGHRSAISEPLVVALKDAGVEYISTRSIGFDHIDLDAAANAGITVENVVYDPDGVADYTLMLILMALRSAKDTLDAVARRDFRLARVRSRDLSDLTVGVVGVGRIGDAVIRRLRGFGCRVLAHDTGRSATAAARFVSLDELLRESDVVTLHLPLTAHTHHLVGRAQIATMKAGAVLVNTGRGALVDTAAMVDALETGALGGAALDVLEGEDGIFSFDCTNRPIDHRFLPTLLDRPNVIVTPHTAYYTQRALHDTVERTLARCLDFERRRVNA